MSVRFAFLLVVPAVIGMFIASCSTNPATGQKQFTALMPAESEARIGAEEHSKIIAAYGVVEDAKLKNLVESVGQKIVPHTERADVNYTFTILDSPEVNAFALPGGYVYVTRGILALADSEDELAAVMAHEIGHVTARHSAERYSRSVATGLGATVLSVLLNTDGAGDLLGLGANLYLSSYSRGQEHEADDLGIRYISRAGYDPEAMSSFLTTMDRYHDLQQQRMGKHAKQQSSYFSTHPVTRDRISQSRVTAANTNVPKPARIREPYLAAINGMVYGDSEKQGFVDDGQFVHPKLGFAFNTPAGYVIKNSQSNIVIMSPQYDAMAIMDGGQIAAGQGLDYYLRNVWIKNKTLTDVQRRNIAGRPAILAQFDQVMNMRSATIFVAAIQWTETQLFRFQIAIPNNLPVDEQRALLDMVTSFRALSAREKESYKPTRLVTVRSSGNTNIADIAGKMPFDDGLNDVRFRMLNGLSIGESLQKGAIYKTVVQ